MIFETRISKLLFVGNGALCAVQRCVVNILLHGEISLFLRGPAALHRCIDRSWPLHQALWVAHACGSVRAVRGLCGGWRARTRPTVPRSTDVNDRHLSINAVPAMRDAGAFAFAS
jgi:hypothetical protein